MAIGNYGNVKRFDMLMEVMNYFYNNQITLYLVLIGKDESKSQENFNKVLQLKNQNVHIMGLKPNVADFISLGDALIISSSVEGMPLVALEAMSLGKPVITTPAGGVVDIIHQGINGFVAKDLSKEALISSVSEFLNTSGKTLEQIQKNNLETFYSRYSIQRCTSHYMNIYQQN